MMKAKIFFDAKKLYSVLPLALQLRFWRILTLAVIAAVTEFFLAAAVSLLGVSLASPQTVVNSKIVQWLIGHFSFLQCIEEDPRFLLAFLLLGLCIATFFKTIFLAILTWRQSLYGQLVRSCVGSRLYHCFLHAPYLWHVSQQTSDLMTKLGWQSNIGIFVFNGLQILSQLVVVFVLLLTVGIVAPLAGVIVFGATGFFAYVIFRLSRKWVHHFSVQCAEAQAEMTHMMYAGLEGVREVMIYRQQSAFETRYSQAVLQDAKGQGVLPVFSPLPSWVLEFVGLLLLLITVLILQRQNESLAHLSATVTLLAAVAWRLLPLINRIVQCLLTLQQNVIFINSILDTMSEVEKLPQHGTIAPVPCVMQQALELRNVCFRYPSVADGTQDALQNISMRIPRGGMVGLVGPSGAGKSTIVNLLTGLYPPTGGKLLIDDREITEEMREGWIRSIGYVPQSPFLLNGSIAENVAFSHWGTEINWKQVELCCRMAAMDFVKDLEDGLETVIGPRGVRLSGGQIQRVSIARALYSNPQFILFDEATSALDGASERAIQQTINNLRKQITMVVIAHRLTTVEMCDYIYWIEQGVVRMEGSPSVVLPAYGKHLQELAECYGK